MVALGFTVFVAAISASVWMDGTLKERCDMRADGVSRQLKEIKVELKEIRQLLVER
jgi:hypothetical protein